MQYQYTRFDTSSWTIVFLEDNASYYQNKCKGMTLGKSMRFLAKDIAKDITLHTGHSHSARSVLNILKSHWYRTSAVIPQHGQALEAKSRATRENLIQTAEIYGGNNGSEWIKGKLAEHDARIASVTQLS